MSAAGQPQPSSGSDILSDLALYVGGTAVAVLGSLHAAVLAGARLSGGHLTVSWQDTWTAVQAAPLHPLDGYPTTVSDQLPPAPLVWALVAVFLAVPVSAWWLRARHRARQRRQSKGLATARDLKALTAGPAIEAARTRVPSLAGQARPAVSRAAMFLACAPGGEELYFQLETSVIVIGPPRQGKTTSLGVGLILDAPGACVATSTKAEVVWLTAASRARGGRPVHVLDLEGLIDWPNRLRWDPVAGCQDPKVAMARARAFTAAVSVGEVKNGDFFRKSASVVLRCLLHAAAVGGKDMSTVWRWSLNFSDPEPLEILSSNPVAARGWDRALRSRIAGVAAETVSGIEMTLALVLDPLAIPEVMDAVTPDPEQGLDVEAFIQARGTIYLLSEGDDGGTAPFVTALTDYIVSVAKTMSQREPGGVLDPALRLVLDEAANIAALPDLPKLLSDSGGRGITTIVMLQGFAQGQDRWGRAGFKAMWNAATAKVVLGGLGEDDELERLSRLIGDRKITRASTTTGGGGRGTSVTHTPSDERVMRLEEIRGLPIGQALLLASNVRPVIVTLRAWWLRRDAEQIRQDIATLHDSRQHTPTNEPRKT